MEMLSDDVKTYFEYKKKKERKKERSCCFKSAFKMLLIKSLFKKQHLGHIHGSIYVAKARVSWICLLLSAHFTTAQGCCEIR